MTNFQMLKQFVLLELLMVISVYWTLFQESNADTSWNKFALCSGCTGQRLVVSGNLFQPRLIAKAQVYLWPDGDGPDSIPIRTECDMYSIILIERNVNLSSGAETKNTTMSFYDMYRLFQLNAYPLLRILFRTTYQSNITIPPRRDMSDYTNVFMSPNGTLSNLTYDSSRGATVDIFNLKGQPMKPTPFVNVTDDRYGCGSFWLLDATNATYCPGGAVGMFGTLRTNGTRVVNTGIRVPTNVNGTVIYVKVFLADPKMFVR